MRIVDLSPTDTARIEAIAAIVYEAFADFSPEYLPTLAAAHEAVMELFEPDCLSRVALAEDDQVAGWVGGRHAYGRLWELHPLAVAAAYRRRGCGRLLVQDLAREVAARGGLTLEVSTSDESDRTNIYARDLYADPLAALRELRSTREHPLDFYLRIGFKLVGLMPDAEGLGKHSIHFAMRVPGAR
jgi:aminoglycoside 6'-N-acetyltransferase I